MDEPPSPAGSVQRSSGTVATTDCSKRVSAAAAPSAIHSRSSTHASLPASSRYWDGRLVPIGRCGRATLRASERGGTVSLYDALRAAGVDLQRAHRLDAYLRSTGDDTAPGGFVRSMLGDPDE